MFDCEVVTINDDPERYLHVNKQQFQEAFGRVSVWAHSRGLLTDTIELDTEGDKLFGIGHDSMPLHLLSAFELGEDFSENIFMLRGLVDELVAEYIAIDSLEGNGIDNSKRLMQLTAYSPAGMLFVDFLVKLNDPDSYEHDNRSYNYSIPNPTERRKVLDALSSLYLTPLRRSSNAFVVLINQVSENLKYFNRQKIGQYLMDSINLNFPDINDKDDLIVVTDNRISLLETTLPMIATNTQECPIMHQMRAFDSLLAVFLATRGTGSYPAFFSGLEARQPNTRNIAFAKHFPDKHGIYINYQHLKTVPFYKRNKEFNLLLGHEVSHAMSFSSVDNPDQSYTQKYGLKIYQTRPIYS